MSWVNGRIAARLAVIAVLGALTTGCFQPMYAERTVTGEPALRDKLSSVDLTDIQAIGAQDARLAVELRNGLLDHLSRLGHGALTSRFICAVGNDRHVVAGRRSRRCRSGEYHRIDADCRCIPANDIRRNCTRIQKRTYVLHNGPHV